MSSVSELRFAQKYPFSKIGKRVVVESGFTIGDVPESVMKRAHEMVASAFSEKEYNQSIQGHSDILKNEILAFPVSKIIVTLINRMELYRRYCSMFASSVSKNLAEESNSTLFDIADEFGVGFDFLDDKDFFAQVSLQSYLRPSLEDVSVKLVNQKVENGKVYLSKNEFIRLLSMIVAQDLRNSLPVQFKETVPVYLKKAAENLESEFAQTVRKQYSKTDFGKVSPESFPPCMAKIYSDLIAGVKVNHSARFAIATFLNSVGMDSEQIINMYRSTPNFNEKITRYHVERIAGKGGPKGGYSAPGCDKMRSYNLCVANCPVSHPVQFYSNEVMRGKGAVSSIKVPVSPEESINSGD